MNCIANTMCSFTVFAKYDRDTAADMKFVNKAKKDREGLVKEISDQLKKELSA